jgi:hypothetical protein
MSKPILDQVNYKISGDYLIAYATAGIDVFGRVAIPHVYGTKLKHAFWQFVQVNVYADWSGGDA